MDQPTAKAAEAAARASFGRLVAFLAARSGDLAQAEDALGDALLIALQRWPVHGVPANPEAWLLTVARRRRIDEARHATVTAAALPSLQVAFRQLEAAVDEITPFPDERLALLCACAHPALDPAIRAPLMLQVVLGIDAARIGSAYLVSPEAMTKRLTRAKTKIKASGIGFTPPDPTDLRSRLDGVLDGLYAAYGLGWDDLAAGEARRAGLAEEALWLSRLTAQLCHDPEALGLLALMLFCEARREARRDRAGAFVPLDRQEMGLWSADLAAEAEQALRTASACRQLGRFQLEAAIQAVHMDRRRTARTDWPAIAHLYEGLLRLAPGVGAAVGHAAAIAQAGDPDRARSLLDALDQSRVSGYQPYWATRGFVLCAIGDREESHRCYRRASGLTEDKAVRDHLIQLTRGVT